jgi:hypothetical protein
MTTPLLISNSAAIELRNIMKYFEIGAHARYKEFEGYINFVCDDYITLCISEKDRPDEHSKTGKTQCCMLVYAADWGDLEVEPIKQYAKPNVGETNDHPGNEMLPSIGDR